MSDTVLGHIVASIAPASAEAAHLARRRLHEGKQEDLGAIAVLAERLAGARHSAEPSLAHKHVVICAADHGVVAHDEPGKALPVAGQDAALASPRTSIHAVMQQIASGHAAVNTVARTAGASVLIVDCGTRGQGQASGVLDLRIGHGTSDIRRGPAMSAAEAMASVETGIALLLSLADAGVDCLALGQLAPGSQPVSAAVVAALAHLAPDELGERDRAVVEQALAANAVDPGDPLSVLAALGGYELGVLCGLMLAAASLHIPVILDDHGTSAAALLAARLAPQVTGYLFASHAGSSPGHVRALSELGLSALFDLGLAHGEGTGAALALPLLESAARLVCEQPAL